MKEKKIYKLGLDLHGVTDKVPDFFSILTKRLVENGHEVHLMTGEHEGPLLDEQIEECGIVYTHLFSIADWHKRRGTDMSYDADGNPWMDSKTWDASKAMYAEEEGIDMVIDDTARYGTYFKDTIFMSVDIELPGEQAQAWMKHRRKGMDVAAKNKTWIRKDRDLVRDGFPNVIGILPQGDTEYSFQDLIDASYDKGLDLYKVIHEKYHSKEDNTTYHFFLTEPFFNIGEWEQCVCVFKREKDRRLWKKFKRTQPPTSIK